MSFGIRFGRLVRAYREAQGLNAGELAAEALGDKAKRTRISELENGKVQNPQAATIDALVGYLAIPFEKVEACHTPLELPDEPGLPRDLLENLALRFGHDNPDAPEGELAGFLKAKAADYKEMQERLSALAAAEGRIANLVGAAQAALTDGDFDEADARLEDAEDIQQTDHTLVQVEKQANIRIERARTALLRGDVELAAERFEAAAAMFGPFDRGREAELLYRHEEDLYWNALRYGGGGIAKSTAMLRRALTIWTRSDDPVNWAKAQNSLGIALKNQGIRSQGATGTALLAEAVTAYRAALEVHTREAEPVRWAITQNNLGTALQDQGIRSEGAAGAALLAEAVTAYRAALEVRTREAHPVDWAMTQENLGIAFEAWAAAEPAAARAHLETALTHLDNALEVFDPQHMSYNHAKATKSRTRIAAALAALEG